MRLLAPLALLGAMLLGVVWLDDTPTDADLVFVNQNEVFTLDPQRMSYVQDLRLAHALYDGLVRWDNADFSILPGVAVALPDVSPDGRTYTFALRPDARWSNGDPVTAHDFIYSWRRAVLPDTAADYSNLFFVIDGAEAYFDWRSRQTWAFTADPFPPGDDRAERTRRAVERLRGLLAAAERAEELPAGVAAAPDDRALLDAELDRLERAAADGDGPGLDGEIASAVAVPAWLAALDARESRVAEAAWMLDAAERRFTRTVGLQAPDDHTLVIRLVRPTAYFADLLCFGPFFPVHRPTVEGWPEMSRPAGWHRATPPPLTERRWLALLPASGRLEQKHGWARPGRHVGNGPYVLEQWRYKRDLRLRASETYHDRDRVRAQSILALTIEDTNTAVLAFESGRVDWLVDVSVDYQADMIAEREAYEARYAEALADLRARGRTIDEALAALPAPERGERRNIHVFPTFGTDFYSFNCRPLLNDGRTNPFADARVRRAFTMATDKHEIVRHVTRLNEPVATTLIPPHSIIGYESPAGLPYDIARARAELADAGWTDRNGDGLVEDEAMRPFPVVDLLYTTNIPRYKWISLNLKDQWERALGVRIELRGIETKFYKEDLKLGDFMIARGRWYGDYGDPTTFLDLCRSTDGNNDRAYASDYVDGLLDDAADERDPVRRMEILAECERFLVDEEVPMLVLCQLVQVYMYEPGRVEGLSDHARLTQFFWQMQVHDE